MKSVVLSWSILAAILSAPLVAKTPDKSKISSWEYCRLALRVLWGHTKKANQPAPIVFVDLERIIGEPLPWGVRGIANRMAPLFSPALEANILYRRVLAASKDPENRGKSFMQVAYETVGHRIILSARELEKIPTSGPFLMISNHPTGVLDGATDARILEAMGRTDYSILVAHFLEETMKTHPELPSKFIYVDRRHRKFDNKPRESWSEAEQKIAQEADTLNRREFRRMLELKKRGGALILYPSGSIASQLPHSNHPVTYDSAWDPTTVTMAKTMGVVVPTFKVVRNSDHYLQLKKTSIAASRRAYFGEALNKHGVRVEVIIGEPITWKQIEEAVPFDREHFKSLTTESEKKSYDDLIQLKRLAFLRSKVDELDPTGMAGKFAPQ